MMVFSLDRPTVHHCDQNRPEYTQADTDGGGVNPHFA